MSVPSYISIYQSGELQNRIESISTILKECILCPHQCRVNRLSGEMGRCQSGILPVVSAYQPHFGEESCLVGRQGSGTIFFSHCNLSCIFCQNYDISQLGHGQQMTYDELARTMIMLQAKGCHNINLVSPTHMIYAILRSLQIAIPMGLSIPLVYNTGGYDDPATLRQLDGIIDIYMPDVKYMDDAHAYELSGVRNYSYYAQRSLEEMYAQVGDLTLDYRGIAVRGVIVRHLVLPDDYANTLEVLKMIARISRNTYINIMDQYRPEFRARAHRNLRKRLMRHEYLRAIEWAVAEGLMRIDGYSC